MENKHETHPDSFAHDGSVVLLFRFHARGRPAGECRAARGANGWAHDHAERHFFSDLWGNNTADIDVRSLLHEYPLIAQTQAGDYQLNRRLSTRWIKKQRKTVMLLTA